jgi:hypothetical protein
MQPIEKTGSFYLGRVWDAAAGKTTDEAVMYDARDLTTHAVCVGMTGSGKTGMCVGLLEEAALDGVPALIIDPKGDITNLLLTFPDLRPADFEPWINPEEARRKGRDVPAHAEATANMWREGLAGWGQDGDRIRRLKAAAEFRIYTPGSSAGEPVSILASLAAPKVVWAGNEEMLREQIRGVASAILGLAGAEADPVRSPEHIFFATVIEHFWRQGRDLDLSDLIRSLQEPPVRKLGVFDVDTFFAPNKRLELAMALNGLLAAPGFASWLEGTPLDIDRMLYTPDGKPRHAVFSIAHLDDAQRMFFVTLLLESTLAWARRQSGTTSLRALLYMDELFGFMPPTANPPSKTPLLTLLKQARAFGLGVVLTTQNPVDLDYKGLSNTGTWFVGKLQTERDKARMMDGLESAGGGANRGEIEKLISGLDSRVFLMHNVHDDAPTLFHTRWVMSYLCGPLTRDQIRRIQPPAPRVAAVGPAASTTTAASVTAPPSGASLTATLEEDGYSPLAPSLKASIKQTYLPVLNEADSAAAVLVYEPLLVACGQVAFLDRAKNIRGERRVGLQYHPDTPGMNVDWNKAEPLQLAPSELAPAGREGALYGGLPRGWENATTHRSATSAFKDHLYRDHALEVPAIPALKLYGQPDEDEAAFLGRARLAAREMRDLEVDKLNRKMETKLERLEKKLDREERELVEDRAEHKSRKGQELLSAGETLLGMFGVLGRKRSTGLSTAARKRRMTSRAKEDIRESEAEIAALEAELSDLRDQLADDVAEISDRWDAVVADVETLAVTPRRADVQVDIVSLAWAPVWMAPDANGHYDRREAWRRRQI